MAGFAMSTGLIGLAMCCGLQGCATSDSGGATTTAAVATEYLDADDAQQLMFECKPAAGAPRQLIRIFKATEVVNDAPEDQTDHEPDGGEATEAVVAEAKAVVPSQQAVRIALNNEERGIPGRCSRTAPYKCQAADESLRIAWPEATDLASKVEVKEEWLLGTKTYHAGCKGQVL